MKNLTALYEHLQIAYDEAYDQGLWQLASQIEEIKLLIKEFRAEKES